MANLPLRLAVRVHCGHQACAQHGGVHARVLKRHSTEGTPQYSQGTLGVYRYRGTRARQHAARKALPPPAEHAVLPVGSSVSARMTEGAVAGARAARDGAARAEPAAAADGRCRRAARGARGGAGLAAVGAARDGLRGDREAQGASRGCLHACVLAFRLHGPERGSTRSLRVHRSCQSRAGASLSSRGCRTACGVLEVLLVVPYRMLFRFPMWSEPAAIRSARALCVVVRD